MMIPNTRLILERAIEEGVKYGYIRAFKHNDSPREDAILASINDGIWLHIDEFFRFENAS
jgi:hypothetical protein